MVVNFLTERAIILSRYGDSTHNCVDELEFIVSSELDCDEFDYAQYYLALHFTKNNGTTIPVNIMDGGEDELLLIFNTLEYLLDYNNIGATICLSNDQFGQQIIFFDPIQINNNPLMILSVFDSDRGIIFDTCLRKYNLISILYLGILNYAKYNSQSLFSTVKSKVIMNKLYDNRLAISGKYLQQLFGT